MIGALLDTINDKNDEVAYSVASSIKRISHHSPEVVIHASVYYFELHRKISAQHASSILQVMMETLRDEAAQLSEDLAKSVSDIAVEKLTQETEKEASELLISLNRLHPNQAIGGLLTKFQLGSLPTCRIIRAMGLVVSCNPFDTVPFIKLILNLMHPMLYQIKDADYQHAICFLLGKFAEAINDYIMNLDEAPDSRISKEKFTEEMSEAFDKLTNNWLTSNRNNTLAKSILTAVCPILSLLPEQDGGIRAGKLVPSLLTFCNVPVTRLSATRVLAMLLNNTGPDKEPMRPLIEPIQESLFDLVSTTPFETHRDALLTHYEVLQCFRGLVVLFPDEGLEKVLSQLRSIKSSSRSRALVVIRHLINTLPTEDDVSLQKIAQAIQSVLSDVSGREIVGAIVALAAHPTLTLLPSQRAAFIRFIVLKCGADNEDTAAYEEAVFLLATTVDGAESWLWPSLLKSLLDANYSSSAVSILRALTALAVKIIRNDNSGDSLKEFSGTKVLARCLHLLEAEENRLAVVIFLRSSAPLFGHQLKPEWDVRLLDISKMLEEDDPESFVWQEAMAELIEKSAELEGKDWTTKLADELWSLMIHESVSLYFAAVVNVDMLGTLITLAGVPFRQKYPKAVGIAAKRYPALVMDLMIRQCADEDLDFVRHPMKFLGLVKDVKGAAYAEARRASLLRCYGEICKRCDAPLLFPYLEEHVVHWIVKQLNDCKELSSKEAGLFALEQAAAAVHPNKLANSKGLKGRSNSLASLLNLLQSHTGYRPLQLYPSLLQTMISLLKIPPILDPEERQTLLSNVLDKIIGASTEIELILSPEDIYRVIEGLGTVCCEVIGDSADGMAELMDVLIPWMQSKSSTERKTTLLVLRRSLKSYHDSLRYTYPGGKLEPGRLLGRILSWSADSEWALRPLVVDSVSLAVEIGARHRSQVPDNNLNQHVAESKKILVSEEAVILFDGVKMLATAACERIASGEVVSLAEGLIEGLLYRGQSGTAAGIALTQLFTIRGADIPRSDLYLIDNIISQMRQMENTSCRRTAAIAVKSLTLHHPEEVMEHLLHQPLPPDRGTEECWRELGSEEECGLKSLEFLLNRLENNHILSDSSPSHRGDDKYAAASLPSLAAIVALRHLLQSLKSEVLIIKYLAELITILLKYLSGWMHVFAPVSLLSTKFGFVPNREACKLNPHREVYSVLTNLLTVVNIHVASSLLNETTFDSDTQANENLISTVRSVIRCLLKKNDVLVKVAQSLGRLVTSHIPNQRAVAIAFYAELIGRIDCGAIWLDAIINTLHEAKSDSSFLVRKLAIIGLTRIAYLEPKQIDEYFDNAMVALLDGLEEPAGGNGGTEVILESLRGLTILLPLKIEKPVSPRVVLALKPFVEKESWELRMAAISALGAISRGWLKTVKCPDDDVTDHLLGCLPCLVIRLEDACDPVARAARETLGDVANLLQCESLAQVIHNHLAAGVELKIEPFFKDLVGCLVQELPQRAEELRNSTVRGYARSEVCSTRATSVLILGFFGQPRPEDVQRMLQLLRDKENIVKSRAAKALALSFTV